MSTPDHLIADLARRVFERRERPPPADAFDRELWETCKQAGLEQVLITGEASALRDGAAVVTLAGYHAARVPLAEAMVARWTAMRVGWSEESAIPTVAPHAEEAVFRPHGRGATRLRGRLEGVPFGRHASAVFAVVDDRLLRIEAADATVIEGRNLAGEPRDGLIFDGDGAAIRTAEGVKEDELLGLLALMRAATMAGAMARALDLALEHAATRVQFGRPIGKFQAVQQMLAQLAGHGAAAAAAVDLGCDAFAAGDPVLAAGLAKSRTAEAAGHVAEIAHQVMGAMGFAIEHPLHLATLRLLALRDEVGNEAYWHERIGARAMDAGPAQIWSLIEAIGRAPEEEET